MAKKVDVALARQIQGLQPGDDAGLRAVAVALAAGAWLPIMDSARLAGWIEPDTFADRALAQAVRVAIAYGDLSGLQGCGLEVER